MCVNFFTIKKPTLKVVFFVQLMDAESSATAEVKTEAIEMTCENWEEAEHV
jgi:hypothetical protein